MAYVEMVPLMIFIDASNFTHGLERHLKGKIDHHKPHAEIFPIVRRLLDKFCNDCGDAAQLAKFVRAYWFASYRDDGPDDLAEALVKHMLEPRLFKQERKRRTRGEKGVDMALGLELITNAFHKNFEIGVLVAGDADYVGLVGEAKRYGQRIYGAYFEQDPALSKKLRRSFDRFFPLEELLSGQQDKLEILRKQLPPLDAPNANDRAVDLARRRDEFLARMAATPESERAQLASELLREAHELLKQQG